MRAVKCFLGGVAVLAAGWVLGADKVEIKKFKVNDLEFTQPAKWQVTKPTSRMRQAQFRVVAGKGKEHAECVFFYFGPGGAGGVEANFTRWLKQFSPMPGPKDFQRGAIALGPDKVKLHVLKANGTYLDGPPFGAKIPKRDYRMYGAIIMAPRGAIFVKMTGPKAVVIQAEGDCLKMIQSAFMK